MATVLTPFSFAADGFTVEKLNIGDERDFGSKTQGLVDEEYIEAEGFKKSKKK